MKVDCIFLRQFECIFCSLRSDNPSANLKQFNPQICGYFFSDFQESKFIEKILEIIAVWIDFKPLGLDN